MSEYLITARDGACRAGLSIQALRVVRLFSASNLTQGCQKIAVATWAFYHRLESNRSSTENTLRGVTRNTKVSHGPHCRQEYRATRDGPKPDDVSGPPSRHGTHNTVDGPGRPIEPGRLPFPIRGLELVLARSCWREAESRVLRLGERACGTIGQWNGRTTSVRQDPTHLAASMVQQPRSKRSAGMG